MQKSDGKRRSGEAIQNCKTDSSGSKTIMQDMQLFHDVNRKY
jgi:hypothetical protein